MKALTAIISFRGLATLLSMQGQASSSGALNKLADAIESGMEVDAYMEEVAEAMKSGNPAHWDDIVGRINAEADEFLSRDASGRAPPDDTVIPETE